MFSSKKLAILVLFVMIAPLVLAACGPTPEPQVVVETVKETVVVEGQEVVKEVTKIVEQTVVEEKTVVETQVVEVTAVPEAVERNGAWVDTVVMVEEPSGNAAVTRLEAGDIDVYAYAVSEPDVAQQIFDSEMLAYETAYGNFNEITFNPYGPTFNDGRLNPFSSAKVREAMNWLIDRDYIAQEISGGLARPRFVAINYASKDSALLADIISAVELKYAHNQEKAVEVINAEMEAMGATLTDGKWTFNGEPVVLIGLIRTEDERLDIGDYYSNVLEDIGFTVQRDYKTSAEASPCWMRGDPAEGCFHFYTGGWVSTAISLDEGSNFAFFYTDMGLPFPLWQAYQNDPAFYEIATKLLNNDFTTMDERRELMAQAIDYSLLDSVRIWLKDDIGIAPHAPDITVASDLSGSIYGSWLWAQTLKRGSQPGGSVTIAMPSIMTEPWNPVAGTNWVYDMMPIRSIGDNAVVPDPFTGLNLPNRLAKGELFAEEGLPIGSSLDWVTVNFVPAGSIVVPDDAWVDWDAENQVFLTAAEVYTQTTTVKTKVVMTYEDDLFDKIKWHDGSPLSIGDFVLFMIMQFDLAKEASPYYDEAQVANFESFMDAFRGWKIVSQDPLVIEYYTDAYSLDAENNISNFRAAYPSAYAQGQGAWHNLAAGLRAEEAALAAFSPTKAEALTVEWMSYISGPSIDVLKAQLDAAQAESWLPYAPTMSQFVTAEEITARYANLQEWYRRYGHFYIGTGPMFLQRAFPVEGTLILQRNEAYPDSAEKWNRFASAPIPEVLVDGPDQVKIGEEAAYDIYVTFNDEPYAVDDIMMVKYLVFDATGNLAVVGDAEAVEDGLWRATLTTDVTGALTAGSNQFAAIAVSKRALIPVRETLQFVTQ